MSKKVIFVRRRGGSRTKEEEVMGSVDVEDRLEISGQAVDNVDNRRMLLRVTGPDRQQSCFDHCPALLAKGHNKDGVQRAPDWQLSNWW